MKSDQIGHRVYLVLAGLFLVFIAYTSWRPPSDDPWPYRGFFTGMRRLAGGVSARALRDLVTNLVLYAPLGGFVAAALAARRARFWAWWLAAGFVVSVVMEAGQGFFGRVPDALDIITNTTGYLLGYAMIAQAARRGFDPGKLIGFDPKDSADARTQHLAVARFIYVCIYVMVALLPFDLSVNYSLIYYQVLPDSAGTVRLILDPLYHLSDPVAILPLALQLVALLPIAVISTMLNAYRGRADLAIAVFPCIVVALFVEAAQIFIQSRTTDIALVPLALIAGVLGWAVVRWRFRPTISTTTPAREMNASRGAAVLLVLYVVFLVCLVWAPFEFEPDHRFTTAKLREFFQTFHGTIGPAQAVLSFVLVIPVGVLLWQLISRIVRGGAIANAVALAAVVVVASFVELARFMAVDQIPHWQSAVFGSAGGAAGILLRRLIQPRRDEAGE